MRGYLRELDPVLAAVLYSFQQIREDVAKWTAGLTEDQLWFTTGGVAPVGFQLRHIAGSTDRLISYVRGESLTDEQLRTLESEQNRGDATLTELQNALEQSLQKAELTVRSTDPTQFGAPRELGRKRIPTTVAGLLIHTAEHAQRHLGAMITAAKLARQA